MNVYGYEQNSDKLRELKEVTLKCDYDELTVIISFLKQVHTQMNEHGKNFGHEHLQDWKKEIGISHSGPDIIVFNSLKEVENNRT